MVVGARAQARPMFGETDRARETLSAKPLVGTIVIAEDPVTPGRVVTIDGLAETEKSVKVKVNATELVTDPSDAVTTTVKSSVSAELHDNVELPFGVGIPVFDRVHVMPVAGLAATDNVIVPVRPPLPTTVILENGLLFTGLVKLDGLAVNEILLGVEVTVT